MTTTQPNILYLLVDQMSGIGPAPDASPYAPCPNLRRLAGRATNFSRAYCTNPLCVPSRGSLFSGRPPHALGLVDGLKVPFEDGWSEEGIFPLFARHGYRNVYAGKWHLPRNDLPENAPSLRRIAPFCDEGVTEACARFLETEAVADDGRPFRCMGSRRGRVLRATTRVQRVRTKRKWLGYWPNSEGRFCFCFPC